jgi:putative SOS response-associated peptidase YedK
MCNDYGIDIPFRLFVEAFEDLGMPLDVSGGIPNLEPRDEIWPTERAPVIRLGEAGPRMDMLTWGLPASRPKAPVVINMRSEGRRFERGRCLIPASHFYEFTGTRSPKTRWRFTKTGEDWFCIAGVTGGDGAAFSMLTVPPGPDVAPIHNRQIVVLERNDWRAWLEGGVAATALLAASPAGSLALCEAPRQPSPTLFER